MQGGKIKPLRTSDVRARRFFGGIGCRGEFLVEREANRLDGNVGCARTFEKGAGKDLALDITELKTWYRRDQAGARPKLNTSRLTARSGQERSHPRRWLS